MAQTTALLSALKAVLREQKITYQDVADHLAVSEASVKRLFSEKQFSLKRLDAVCELAGIEITDLAKRVDQAKCIDQLPKEFEQQLVDDEKLLIAAVSALNHWAFEEIIQVYDFTESELIQKLAQLDRMKLIELLPANRIKPLASKEFAWIPGGPIQRFYESQVQQDFFNSRFNQPGEIRIFVTGMLSRESNEKLQKKLQRIASDFAHLDREDQQAALEGRYGTSLVLAMRPWEMDLFKRYRRPGTNKNF